MYISDEAQRQLRQMGKLMQNEVLKKEGDLFIAINVQSQQRRIVNIDSGLVESLQGSGSPIIRRGILKG